MGCTVSQEWAWLPVAVDNQMKVAHSDLIPCYIWCSKLASPLFEPSGCVVIVVIALWWSTEGYRVMSLSRRSLEEMRRRCMVRVMFNRWALPNTQPSVSARQKTSVNLCCNKVEWHYQTACHPLKILYISCEKSRVSPGLVFTKPQSVPSCTWNIRFM